jgi:kynurenine formamidase
MTFSAVHDLTALLESKMPTWPTSPPPLFEPVGTVARDGYLIEHIDCLTHTGTHMDAPSHFLEGATSVDRIAPSALVGSACVLDLRTEVVGTSIPSDAIRLHWPKDLHPEIILLQTGWSRRRAPSREYLYDFPGIDPTGARWLADHRLKGVGTDTLGIDPFSNTAFEAHKILLGEGIWILEALDHLDLLKEGVVYTLVAAPMKLANGSGGMARVFALEPPRGGSS